ncbi:MAG: cytochrome-c peroxidase [Anaerolineae bacterium]
MRRARPLERRVWRGGRGDGGGDGRSGLRGGSRASGGPRRAGAPSPTAGAVDPDDRAALAAAFGVAPLAALRTAYPPNNAPSAERAALGRLLFFDPVLSGEEDVSCAVCHQPARAFTDGRARSAGVGGGAALGPARAVGVSRLTGKPLAESARNAPTVLNVALLGRAAGSSAAAGQYDDFLSVLFWDGRSDKGLEGQALHPLGARDEMAGDAYLFRDAHWTVLARLRAIPEYDRLFRGAFPDLADEETAITSSSLARAIAAFERTLITPDAPFDRWLAGTTGRCPRRPCAARRYSSAGRAARRATTGRCSPTWASTSSARRRPGRARRTAAATISAAPA